MRKKELRLVITFSSTATAMKMETEAKMEGLPGRLIPVPREITAGCGLAFSAPVNGRATFEKFVEEKGIHPEGFQELWL